MENEVLKIEHLHKEFGGSVILKDLNLTLEQLSLAAEDAGKTEFINSLPRSMSSDDLFALIKTAY